MIDYATRYPDAIPLTGKTSMKISDALLKFFTRTGFPKVILSDQDPGFISRALLKLYEQLGIEKVNSTPYHPQTIGLVEKFQGDLKKMLKK